MSAGRIDPDTLPGRPCSIASALAIVGDRWSLLIVREVMLGNRRFNRIVRNTGAPRDRIAARLRDLVDAGVLERRPGATGRSWDEYHLTVSGRGLAPVIQALLDWGDTFVVTRSPVRTEHHDHRLQLVSTCAVCGEQVHSRDVRHVHLDPNWETSGPAGAAARTPDETPITDDGAG
jgi:DNA-binding HxlR family transcriptional regulator